MARCRDGHPGYAFGDIPTKPTMANSFQQHLDAIDIALVRMLQAQGRLTNADLAERVGLSPSACLRRVQRLEQDGVIGEEEGTHRRWGR